MTEIVNQNKEISLNKTRKIIKNYDNSLVFSVTKRMLEVCDIKKIKQVDLIKMNLASQQTVYDVFKGKQKPGIDFLMKFLEIFKDVRASWLINGSGEMLKNEAHNNIINEPRIEYNSEKENMYSPLLKAQENEIAALKQTIEVQQKLIERLTK